MKAIFTQLKLSAVLALFAVLLIPESGMAQISYSNDFNANSTGWTGNITRTTQTTACGSPSMRRNLYGSVPTGNMVTPALTGNNGFDVTVSYDYKAANWSANTVGTNPWGSFDVQFGSSPTGPWTTVTSIVQETQNGSCISKSHTFTPPATGDVYIKWDCFRTSGDFYMNFDNVVVTQATPPCTGTPNAGTAAISSNSSCSGTPLQLSATGLSSGTGISYQWQISTDNATWSNIGSATSPTYSVTSAAGTHYYRIVTTCSASGLSNQSPSAVHAGVLSCSVVDAPNTGGVNVACGSNARIYDSGGSGGDYSANDDGYIVLENSGTGVIDLTGTIDAETNWDFVNIYDGAGIGGTQLFSYTGTGALPPFTSAAGQTITVQMEADGSFQQGGFAIEAIYSGTCASCGALPSGLTASDVLSNSATISWTAASPVPGDGYDYYINTTGVAPTGATVPTDVTAAGVVTAGLTGLTANTTYYWWVRSHCGGSSVSNWASGGSFFTGYCIPASTGGSSFVNSFSTSNAVTDISNTGTGFTSGGYANYTAQVVEMYAGGTFQFDAAFGGPTVGVHIWVDWDNDLQFEASELVYDSPGYMNDITGEDISVPGGTPLGSYRMRIRVDWNVISPDPCNTTSRSEAEDYTLEVVTPPACVVPSGLLASNVLTTSATISWTASPSIPAPGYDYYWNTTGVAPLAGTTPTGSTLAGDLDEDLTGLAPNTTHYFWVRSDCSGSTSAWVGPGTFYTGHCIPASTSGSTFVNAFSTSGGGVNIANFGTGYNSSGYGNFYGSQTVSAYEGQTISFNADFTGTTVGFNIWVDWDNDLLFEESEKMYESGGYINDLTGAIMNAVPASTPLGDYRMRIRCDWNFTDPAPCGSTSRSEAEDYKFTVIAVPPCPNLPSALTSSLVTDNSATISWTAASPAPGNGYDYYVNTTGTAPTGATTPDGTTAAGVTTANITGLTGQTDYYFWVRSNCGLGDVSNWVGSGTFTTLCGPVTTFPYLETFEAASTTRDCWTNVSQAGSASWTYASGSSGGSINSAYAGSLNARFVSQSGTNSPATYLVSPILDLSGMTNPPRVDFWYGQEDWATDQNTTGLYYRTAPGNPWVEIVSYTNSIAAWTNEIVTLPNPTATYQIAFLGVNNWGRANVIDDVLIEETPPCVEPSALTSSNVTSTSADIGWTASPSVPADGYEYYFNTTGAAPTLATTPSGAVLAGVVSESLSGLTPDSDYSFWVRAVCGPGDRSAWFGPATFRTGYCIPSSTTGSTFIEGFTTFGGVDNIAHTGTGYTSGGYADYTSLSVSMWEGGSFTFDADFTGTTVGVHIWVDWDNDLQFEASELVYDSPGYMGDLSGETITVPASTPNGSYTMRIRCDWNFISPDPCNTTSRSEAEDYTLEVITIPPCPNLPSALTASNITLDAATISWTAASPAPANGYDYYFDTSNTAPTGATTPSGSTAAGDVDDDLTGLSDGTVYYYWVRSDCGLGDVSNWVGPYSFNTLFNNPFCLESNGLDIPDAGCVDVEVVHTMAPGLLGTDYLLESVILNVEHTWDSDLDMTLYSPSGTGVIVSSDNGGSGDNYGTPNACGSGASIFKMTASTPVTAGAAPFIGQFIPEGDFAAFDGEDPNGTWYLEVCDDLGGDVGVIYYLNVNVIPYPTCWPPTALSLNAVSSTTATVGWTASVSSPGTYQYYLTTSVTPPTAGTTPTGFDGSTDVDLLGLTPDTEYNFWIRSDCGLGDLSLWEGPLTFTTAPENDICQGATLLYCGETVSGTSVGSSSTGNPSGFCGTTPTGPGVWYKFVGNGFDATVETCGSTGTLTDSKINVYTGSCGALACEDGNDDDCGLLSSVTVATVPGETYYVLVTGFAGAVGTFDLVYTTTANEWTGATSTDWSVASNWCSGSVPTIADNAYIPANPSGGNFPSIGTDVGVSEVLIAAGAQLNIVPTASLTVDNDITNNGTVNIASEASLTQPSGSTLGGSGTFNISKVGSSVYDYWSSPITNAPVGSIGAPYFYNPATGTADPSDDENDPGWIVASGIMNPGQGYASFGAGSRTFSGTANNGPISISVGSYGLPNVSWNLVGNPYPSGIEFVPFISGNSGILAQAAVYLWDDPGVLPYDPNVQNYAVYSGLGGTAGGGGNTPTSTIGVAQGFKVEVSGNGTLNFDNDMRTTDNPGLLFRQAEMKRMWLTLSNGNLSDETLIGFAEDGTDGVDWLYDAPALNWMANLTFFSLLDNEPYAIQAYGPFDPNKVVPLGMNAGMQMNASITLSQVDGLEDEDIYLEDRYLGIFHDLNESAYQFDTEAALYMDRFFIHYGASVTDIDEFSSNSFGAYVANDVLNVASQEDLEGRLTIVDATGRVVYAKDNVQLNYTGVRIDLSGVTDGIYIVTFATAEATMTKKVLK